MDALTTRTRLPDAADNRRRLALGLIAAAYLLLAGGIVAKFHNLVTTADGLIYIRIAQYYAQGRFDLAVNSYWGPLLSWLLVPAVWLRVDPVMAHWVLAIATGLGFAAATAALAARLAGPGLTVLAFATAAVLALPMLIGLITPDLLLTFLFTWCFARLARLLYDGSAGAAFLTGCIGGLAYLSKAYALPAMVLLLVLTFALRRFALRRPSLRPLLAASAGLLVVCLPWIAVISVRDGTPTFGSSNRLCRAWSPIRKDGADRLPIHLLQKPREGRLTSYEDPLEIAHPWPTWSPLAGLTGLKRQVATTFRITDVILTSLKATDALGLASAGYLLAVFLLLSRRHRSLIEHRAALAWACAAIPLYASGYALVYVLERYLWPVRGLLLAVALSAFYVLIAGPTSAPASAAAPAPARGRRIALGLLSAAMLGSCAYVLLVIVDAWRPIAAEADCNRALAAKLPAGVQVASTSWHDGLCISFWNGSSFIGHVEGTSPHAIAAELGPFGPTCVLIWNDPDLAGRLAEDPRYARLGSYPPDTNANRSLSVFAFPSQQTAGALQPSRDPASPSTGR